MTSFLPQDQEQASSKKRSYRDAIEAVYPACRSAMDADAWRRIISACAKSPQPKAFSKIMALQREELSLPDYLAELARLEWAIHEVTTAASQVPPTVAQMILNPALQLLELSWKHLWRYKKNGKDRALLQTPEPGKEFVLVWYDPHCEQTKTRLATEEDLLILKIVVEGLDPNDVAATGNLPVGAVDAALRRATSQGILLAPRSGIRRDPGDFPEMNNWDERFISSAVFTLQWHITQACDLHCKHCYDRSSRSPLRLDHGIRILNDLRNFCKSKHVRGQVSFTGGNPLLYPHFTELYQAAAQCGLDVAILGNPASRKQMEDLLAIHRPAFYQVSLEGLKEHNDYIRGAGHFERVVEFLILLQDLKIPSKVMLTLTKGNMDQVLPLAELLRNLADDFTFNRLSMVGEGANLQLPAPGDFPGFLEDYMEASKDNPVMGWKDNFINIVCHNKGMEPFGGCTGYGCGAAFNFIAVLSDGEVHACRKFPSPIGNIFEQDITEIYESHLARQYRRGPSACRSCPVHVVCRGCMAVAYSHGLKVFEQRDPYCFMAST